MPKRKPGQLPLEAAGRRAKGITERAAEVDLRELRTTGALGVAIGALTTAYRLCAREVDRAELEQDRWGKLKATSELRAIRTQLGPTAAATTADDLLEQLRTAIRDTPEP